MSPLPFIIILTGLILTLSGFATGSEQNSSGMNQISPGNPSEFFSVPDIMTIITGPEPYLGKTVTVKGIVSETYPRQHRFTFADRVGCSICAAKNAGNSIMVFYAGDIPKNRETAEISGLIVNDTRYGIILNATSVVL